MTKMKAAWMVAVWLLGCVATMQATALTVTQEQHQYQAAPQIRWLADPGSRLTPAHALASLQGGAGQTLTSSEPELGFQEGQHWFLLEITNRSAQRQWYLRAADASLDQLDLHVFAPSGEQLQHRRVGDRVPFLQREFHHHQLVFPLSIPRNETRYLLLRAQTQNPLSMPVSLYSPTAFSQYEHTSQLLTGLLFGALTLLCVLSLLILIATRDSQYLLYTLLMGLITLNLFAREGLAYQWLWPNAPDWNHYALPVLNLATAAFSLLFVSQFLELRQRQPQIHKGLLGASLLLALLIPAPLLHFPFLLQLSAAALLPIPVIAVALSLWLIAHGYHPARYLLIGFLVFAAGTFIHLANQLQLLNGNALAEHALPTVALVGGILLSLALIHRQYIQNTQTQQLQKEATEALEQRVNERTRELNEALSARSEFLAVMSHEIRTPLNGIIGTVDMLKASSLDEEQQHHLNIIEQSGSTLLNLINDILDYSRIEAGKMPIERTNFCLEPLVRECTALFEHRAHVHSVQLSCILGDGLGRNCLGDPARLRQILVNLISNAVKFTENGRVTVRASRERENEDYVLFEVEDTGIGISQEHQQKLFEHFQQGDSSTSRRYGGTGLGLAISRQLVEIMGGEIGVTSKPKQGSRFWFRLPLPATSGATARAPVTTPKPATHSGRLLIVDDNHINLMVAEGLCEKLGYEAEVAESGTEAIAVLLSNSQTFDMVLMDCEMPDMDGFETTRAIVELQKEKRLPTFPIIALTAHAVPDKIEACHEAGMVGHIAKPINLSRLEQILSQTLGKKQRKAASNA